MYVTEGSSGEGNFQTKVTAGKNGTGLTVPNPLQAAVASPDDDDDDDDDDKGAATFPDDDEDDDDMDIAPLSPSPKAGATIEASVHPVIPATKAAAQELSSATNGDTLLNAEIIKLKSALNQMSEEKWKITQEKKKLVESFHLERADLKDQVARSKTIHARSVRAYLRASVTSLRGMRASIMGEDDDDVVSI
jgi:hypothetical protein